MATEKKNCVFVTELELQVRLSMQSSDCMLIGIHF